MEAIRSNPRLYCITVLDHILARKSGGVDYLPCGTYTVPVPALYLHYGPFALSRLQYRLVSEETFASPTTTLAPKAPELDPAELKKKPKTPNKRGKTPAIDPSDATWPANKYHELPMGSDLLHLLRSAPPRLLNK
eukprot:1178391-Prorocentrum_minimum.AAC.2